MFHHTGFTKVYVTNVTLHMMVICLALNFEYMISIVFENSEKKQHFQTESNIVYKYSLKVKMETVQRFYKILIRVNYQNPAYNNLTFHYHLNLPSLEKNIP